MASLTRIRPILLFLILMLSASLVIAACGDDDDDDNGSDNSNGGEVTATTGGDSTGDSTEAEGDATEAEGDTGEAPALDRPLVFGDYGWDSAIVHNRIAQFILENGWGYETEAVAGETITLFQGLTQGDIDISMEIWATQQPAWEPALEEGTVVDFGANFPNSLQGWYVPTYVIEGDEERGIEPMAPDLRSVEDLPEYWELFKDPEDPNKGRFYNCIAGWVCQAINESKFEYYGLGETYNLFQPGSGAALASSIIGAYETGDPWLGYYWEPTWVFAQVDLTMLEEPEWTQECEDAILDEDGRPTGEAGCAYPTVAVHIAANAETAEQLPQEVLDFLSDYETTMEQNNEFLNFMQQNEITDHNEVAIWFLQNYEDVWTQWVPEEVVQKVKDALPTA